MKCRWLLISSSLPHPGIYTLIYYKFVNDVAKLWKASLLPALQYRVYISVINYEKILIQDD